MVIVGPVMAKVVTTLTVPVWAFTQGLVKVAVLATVKFVTSMAEKTFSPATRFVGVTVCSVGVLAMVAV